MDKDKFTIEVEEAPDETLKHEGILSPKLYLDSSMRYNKRRNLVALGVSGLYIRNEVRKGISMFGSRESQDAEAIHIGFRGDVSQNSRQEERRVEESGEIEERCAWRIAAQVMEIVRFTVPSPYPPPMYTCNNNIFDWSGSSLERDTYPFLLQWRHRPLPYIMGSDSIAFRKKVICRAINMIRPYWRYAEIDE